MFRPNRYRRFRPDELALIIALLDVQEPGFDRLRDQLAAASYGKPWFPGAMSFDIHVDLDRLPDSALRPDGAAEPAGEAEILRAQQVYRSGAAKTDENVIGTVFLWVTGGVLSGIEYASSDERAPSLLPAPSQLAD